MSFDDADSINKCFDIIVDLLPRLTSPTIEPATRQNAVTVLETTHTHLLGDILKSVPPTQSPYVKELFASAFAAALSLADLASKTTSATLP